MIVKSSYFFSGKIVRDYMILDRYKIIQSIGKGAFGKVYKCYDTKHSRTIALKTGDTSKPNSQERMEQEYSVYMKLQGIKGIPKLYTIHKSKQLWYLSMECMGNNITKLWRLCKQKFSEKTILMIGIQMIFRLEAIHNRGILHRDIKPDNFVLGRGDCSNSIYLLDFGLSMYMHKKQSPLFTGSLRYASRNSHNGKPYTRKDDLESLMYILLFFYKGSLPWQLTSNHQGTIDIGALQKSIGIKKAQISIDELCSGCPNWLRTITAHILHPSTDVKYEKYVLIMKQRLQKMGTSFDYEYDWKQLPPRVFLR